MEELIEKISEELQIDKSSWVLTKFGDVAIQQKQSVDRENTDLTRYVKGEHMGSEDLHLRSWGELKDEYLGPAFIRRFDEGDILYGSRRTYLRKVVIAPFSGITSNTTFVIKANEDNIDKRLLPFIMMSEGFTENSIRNSKGSVNPYINWKDIAKYEFLLPPKDQQAQLAKLLWAMDDVIEREKEVLSNGNILFKKKLETSLVGIINQVNSEFEKKDGFIQRKLPEIPLNWSYDLVKNEIWFQEGPGVRTTQFREAGVKLLNGTNINDNKLDLDSTNRFISEDEAYGMYNHFLCDEGDLIIACSGIAVEKFNEKITYVREEHLPLCMNTSTMRFKEKSGNVTLDFFKYFLMSNLFKFQINRLITGSAQLNFGPSHMEKIYMPICSFDEQKEIVNVLNQIKDSNLQLEFKIGASQSLQKSLINQVF